MEMHGGQAERMASLEEDRNNVCTEPFNIHFQGRQ